LPAKHSISPDASPENVKMLHAVEQLSEHDRWIVEGCLAPRAFYDEARVGEFGLRVEAGRECACFNSQSHWKRGK
jgi:hypothetical protein